MSFYLSIRQSTYQISQKCKIDPSSYRITSVFPKLALLLIESRANKFFHKIGKKIETKKLTVQKKFSPFKTQVSLFKFKTHHRERRRVNNFQTRFFMYLKENS